MSNSSSEKDIIYAEAVTLCDLLYEVEKYVLLGFSVDLEEGKVPFNIDTDRYLVRMSKEIWDD